MKRILLLLIWPVLAVSSASGQCCPYIGGITIDPAQPTTVDPVKIITQVTTPNIGSLIYSNVMIDGDTILVEACYWEGSLTMPYTITDTLEAGLLPEGSYTVLFTAYNSSSDQDCLVTDQQEATEMFTVDAVSGLPENGSAFMLFPNPVTDMLHIETTIPAAWQLFAADGKLLAKGTETTIDFSQRSVGMYFVRVNGTTRRIVKH